MPPAKKTKTTRVRTTPVESVVYREASPSQPPVGITQLSQATMEKLVLVLTAGLIVGSFFLGYFYGQLRLMRDGGFAAAPTGGAAPTAAGQEEPQLGPLSADQWEMVMEGAAAAQGSESAPVTIVEFLDYRCGFCARYATETYPQIKRDYVDTGKVRYLVRALPFLGPESGNAAQAALCAADQGGDRVYFDYHDLLFANSSTLSNQTYKDLAGQLSLNATAFATCLDGGKYAAQVEAEAGLAMQVGANGTPTFFINGNPLVGAQPYANFQAAIDAEL